MTQLRQILIVSDGAFSAVMRDAFEQRGFQVTITRDFKSAYPRLLKSAFDLVVVELAEDTGGVEFIKRIRATPRLTDILILVLAEWGTGEATLALSQGANAYEPKPIDANRLITSIERLMSKEAAAASQTP